ncbi:hypothetical protein ACLB6G_14460 [Zhengella sp. ZM62]|uniref:hypothetical protein n=1 Tax=Zhengella sedimenti TaxID=3390035 RepID=UPI003976599C
MAIETRETRQSARSVNAWRREKTRKCRALTTLAHRVASCLDEALEKCAAGACQRQNS